MHSVSARAEALHDIRDGLQAHRVWRAFGWNEIRNRYRRSVLGPFWLTLALATTISALAIVYGALFRAPIDKFLPYVAVGFVVWSLISSLVTEGCSAFTSQEWLLRNFASPLSSCVFQLLWRNFLVSAHHFVPLVLMLLAIGPPLGWGFLLVVPALLITALNGFWVALLLGLGCTRFRDLPQIVMAIMQLAFFVTPILWSPDLIGNRKGIVDWNPFYHLIEIVRAPLLGGIPHLENWLVALGIAAVGSFLAFAAFARYRKRVIFWL